MLRSAEGAWAWCGRVGEGGLRLSSFVVDARSLMAAGEDVAWAPPTVRRSPVGRPPSRAASRSMSRSVSADVRQINDLRVAAVLLAVL